MQGQHQVKTHASLKCESVWFKTKLISQFLTLSFLLTQPFYLSYLHAAPIGGDIVGGTGSISQTDLTTTINQSTQNLAIDWKSFDVNTNERVQFIQPNTSSIALNRILSNNGSIIQGQIDANGQVILVNPNGVFFSSTATVNVGGLIASSLDIAPSDFMNGNYIFNEVLGTEGSVINSGIINASVGGNVALLGKQVKNDGLISANLGSVVLAAGKQSILTFDNQGLIGVKVTKEVLQDEIGIEEAVINNGEINAAGGRVLLTASTSQDVFSQVVNNTSIDQATSVVVHEDGSFTLGGGADVLNTGSIDVSLNNTTETKSENAARIILLGENVTSSGSLKADAENNNAGEIEIHANDKALLTHNSITSAQAFESGNGGLIKILGDKVGLFDMSQINASGANGGGEVLFGGDRQGLNSSVRKSSFIYLGENTTIKADATDSGNGGKIITFAKDTARIHGNLYARGGTNAGDGGFVETSGLKGFEITNTPDVTSSMGHAGEWLIDPYDITIVAGNGAVDINGATTPTDAAPSAPFISTDYDSTLGVDLITAALSGGATVTITTSSDGDAAASGGNDGNITLDTHLDFNGSADATLTLKAENNIIIKAGRFVDDSTLNDGDQLNLNLYAKGTVDIKIGAEINTHGGDFTVGDGSTYNPSSFINSGTINTSGYIYNNAGTITRVDSGAININTLSTTGTIQINSTGSLVTNGAVIPNTSTYERQAGFDAGAITFVAGGEITIDGTISAIGSTGNYDGDKDGGEIGGDGGDVSITSNIGNINILNEINASGGNGDGDSDINDGADLYADPGNGGAGGAIDIIATQGSVTLDKITSKGGNAEGSDYEPNTTNAPTGGSGGSVTIFSGGGTGVILNDAINTSGGIVTRGERGYQDTDYDEKGIIGSGGNVDIVADDVDVLLNANGNIITGGGNVTVGNVLGTPVLPSSFTNNAEIKTTGGTNLAAGNITIDSAGSISTGTLTAKGGTTDKALLLGVDGIVGQNGGVVTLNAQDTINVDGVIDTSGSQGDYNDTNTNNGRDGGIGGNVIINTSSSVDVTSNIVTSGGQGDGDNSDDASGGNAGSIAIDFDSNFDLSADLIAKGGDKAGNDGVVGLDNTITINGDDSVNNFTFGTGLTLTGSEIKVYGFAENDVFNIGSDILGTNATNSELIDGGIGNDTFSFSVKKLSTTIAGGTGLDTIQTDISDDKHTVWTIDGNNSGSLDNDNGGIANFTSVENLTGNAKDDDFDFTVDGWIDGLISGGGGSADTLTVTALDSALTVQLGTDFTSNPLSDTELNVDAVETITANSNFENTLIGINVDSIWTITNDSEGNVKPTTDSAADNTVNFIDFFNLTANSSLDEFTFENNGWINGLILGGINDTTIEKDTLNIEAIGTTTVQLGSEQSSISDSVLNANQFETITATSSPNPSSTLVGNNAANTWTITGTNSGTLNPTIGSTGQNTVEFFNFINLTGNVDVDKFTIEAGGWVNGLISGGDNTTTTDLDTVDITALGATIVQLGTGGIDNGVLNINQVESISANSAEANILRGEDAATDWSIDDVNSGSIASTSGATDQNSVVFYDFSNLEGGTEADNFTIGTLGTIVDIDGGTAASQNEYNTLVGRAAANNIWNITANNSGNLTATGVTPAYVTNFDNIQNLSGATTGDDAFVFADDFSMDGLIDGQGHDTGDSVDVSAISADKTFTIGNLIGFNNIELFVGNNGANHTLEASNVTNTWNIGVVSYQGADTDGVNDGTLNSSTTFVDFNTIKGGTAADTFNFDSTGSIQNIDGGVVTTDTATYNIISGRDVANTWNITGIDSGDLNETPATTYISNFSNIQNLNGGAGIDDFSFTVDGWVNGLISGGDNTTTTNLDTVDITALGTTTVQLGTDGIADDVLNINQVESISANSTVANIIRGENAATDWLIDDINSGSIAPTSVAIDQNTVAFYDFSNLEGGTAADRFTIEAQGEIADINGGTTDLSDISTFNTLVGIINRDNTWNITGDNSGNLFEAGKSPAYVANFNNIQNLTGGDRDDAFIFSNDFTISGLIDGKAHISGDSVDVSAITADRTFTIGSLVGFSNIELIIGNNSNHTLQATNGTNLWLIDGDNSGTLTSGGNVLSFVDFNQLIGGSGEDTFRFSESVAISGGVDAGDGIDFVDYSLYATDPNIDVTGTTSTIFHDVTNAEGIIGNNTNSTLNTGTGSTTNLWTIEQVTYNLDTTKVTDNANDGTVNGIYFINFNNLTGNDGEDTFRFNETSSISGIVDAGFGTDFVDYSLYATDPNIDVTGATSTIFHDVTNAEGIIGNNMNSTLNTGTGSTTNLWTIEQVTYNLDTTKVTDNANDGTVNGIYFIDFNNLSGNDGEDTFRFAETSSITGTVNAGTGIDFVDYSLYTNPFIDLANNPFNSVLSAEGIIGNNSTSTLQSTNAQNTWSIGAVTYNGTSTDGENDGVIDGIRFINFNNLSGGTDDDLFKFSSGSSITGLISGGGQTQSVFSAGVGDIVDMSSLTGASINVALENSSNGVSGIERVIGNNTDSTLVGENQTNTWNITTDNGGMVTSSTSGVGGTIEFVAFNNLTGNEGADNFIINDGVNLTGNIDGVQDSILPFSTNTLTIEHSTSNSWTIDQFNSGTVTVGLGGRFSNIDNLIGGTGSDDFTITNTGSLSGNIIGVTGLSSETNSLSITTALSNTWTIDGSNTGITSIGLGGRFTDIDHLTGGSGDDLFNFTAATASISGLISGGGETLRDIVDMSQLTSSSINILLESNTNGVSGIERVIGNNTDSTLTSENQTNTWIINANNSGTVTSSTSTGGAIEFIAFNNLVGNQGEDNFTINDGAFLSGNIDGVVDTVAMITTNSLIIATSTDNTWTIDGSNTGTTTVGQGGRFSNINSITGGSADDTFVVGVSGNISDGIDGGAESSLDTVDISSNAVVTIDLTELVAGTTTYSNIEEFVGNNSSSTLIGENLDATWNITGANTGNVSRDSGTGTTIYFRDFNNLTGGSGDDLFSFDIAGSINGIISGGIQDFSNTYGDIVNFSAINSPINVTLETTDDVTKTNLVGMERIIGNNLDSTLTGQDLNTTWLITDNNDGEVSNSTTGNLDGNVDFINFTNLTGNTQKDDFIFTNINSSLSGLIDGGSNSLSNVDTVNMANSQPVDVTIGQNIIRIETITGNNDGTDILNTNTSTLRSGDLTNETTWEITSLNQGNVTYDDGSGTQVMRFIDFNHIEGGADNNDVFKVDNGSISGSIKGGTGTGIDSVDYSTNGIDITIGADLNGILEIEQVIGNGQDSTIRGLVTATATDAPTYTWTIDGTVDALNDGINDGRVVGGTEDLRFINFGNIVGGSNVDTFNISGSSTITGSIKGGQGNDVINLSLTGAETGGFTFIGEQGVDDKVIMNGGNANYVATYTPEVLDSGNDQFIYDNAGNSYSINYDFASTEVIQNNLTANSLTINGTSGDDIISLDTSTFKVNNSLDVDFTYSNNTNLIIDGLVGGVDKVELIADVGTTAMNFTFANAEVSGDANILFADNLVFNNASAGTNSSQRLATDITSLSITDSGPIYLSDVSNNLDIAQLNTASIVDIYLAAGNISNSTDLISSAAFLANAENGNINITGQNQLSGPITLLAGNGTIILDNDRATLLDDITTTDLTLNIFNSNSTTQSASGIIDANVITLNSNGDFDLGNDNLLNNITVLNSNDININNLNLSNIISINAFGDVNITSNGISLSNISANSISLDAGNAAITDNNGANINLVANTVNLIATGGIGSISNAIDTQITGINNPGELTAINKVGGDISISNVGNILLRKVSNLDGNGDIRFDNIGDLTIDTLETISSYTDNGTGRIDVNVTNGSVYGAETTVDGDAKPFYTTQSDIRAHSVSFLMDGENSIGTGSRPLSVEVPDTVEILLSTQNFIYFYGTEPLDFIGENDLSNQIFDLINNLAGQQLIEIESLAQIDPAIFTDVRNYSHADNALMMPVDQRYDDEEEKLLKHNQ